MGGFALVSDDVLQNILSRLPAKSFGCASCVDRCWNNVCGRILSKPMLASALSLNHNFHVAVGEVLDKILSKPIRPDFAIAFVGQHFCLQRAHQLIIEALGSKVPVITHVADGIIGVDAITDKIKEIKWDYVPQHIILGGQYPTDKLNRGIVLLVGYVPGLKVDIIPVLHPKMESQRAMVDKFINNVKNYTASVSNSQNPEAIILFGDGRVDMKPVIAEIDYAMPEETVIVGDASSCFLWRGREDSISYGPDLNTFNAVGLVFAKDKKDNQGEIKFHVMVSTGIIPFGPRLEVDSVRVKDRVCTWLTAKMEGEVEILDGLRIVESIYEEIDAEIDRVYIGVMKQRNSSTALQNVEPGRYLVYHEVIGADREAFLVAGVGLDPGDLFFFYHTDPDTAKSACVEVCDKLKDLKSSLLPETACSSSCYNPVCASEIFGGMVFAFSGRGEEFFGQRNVNSMPFQVSLPGMPVGGAFCSGEIGRPGVLVEDEEDGDVRTVRCSMTVFSSVYLALSYVPA